MVEVGCFEDLSKNKIAEILNLLAQCSYSAVAKKDVLVAISALVKSKFLENSSSEMIFDVLSAIDKGEDALSIINKIDV